MWLYSHVKTSLWWLETLWHPVCAQVFQASYCCVSISRRTAIQSTRCHITRTPTTSTLFVFWGFHWSGIFGRCRLRFSNTGLHRPYMFGGWTATNNHPSWRRSNLCLWCSHLTHITSCYRYKKVLRKYLQTIIILNATCSRWNMYTAANYI